MPIKNFEKFEESFFIDGKFEKKIYEAYWNDYREDREGTIEEPWGYDEPTSKMISSINFEKLTLMGLLEYQDLVEKSVEHFEKQISNGAYGKLILPPLDDIKDFIISMIGVDFKDYISEDNLDQITRFIYQEIDNYIDNYIFD